MIHSFVALATVSNIGKTRSSWEILRSAMTFLCTPTRMTLPPCPRIWRSAMRRALNPLLSQNSTSVKSTTSDLRVGRQRRMNSPFNSGETETSSFRSFIFITVCCVFFVTSNFIGPSNAPSKHCHRAQQLLEASLRTLFVGCLQLKIVELVAIIFHEADFQRCVRAAAEVCSVKNHREVEVEDDVEFLAAELLHCLFLGKIEKTDIVFCHRKNVAMSQRTREVAKRIVDHDSQFVPPEFILQRRQ